MNTINIPEDCKADDISWAIYMAAKAASDKGRDALANQRFSLSTEIDCLNPDDVETLPELTEVGAVCHCDQRDADEIAVYLKADELLAVEWMMNRVTFGDLDDDVDPLHLHRAMKEIFAVMADRLGGPSLR